MSANRPEETNEVVQTTEEAIANQQPLQQRHGRNVLPVSQEEILEESLPHQPLQQGIYLAEDRNGKKLHVEVVAIPHNGSPKIKILCVPDFVEGRDYVPAIETGLSFLVFVSKHSPPLLDYGKY